MIQRSSSHPRTWHPYRVTSPHRERGTPLTPPQEAVLEALVHLCPRPGSDSAARAVAASAGMRLGSVVLTLRKLETKRLAAEHHARTDTEAATWSPTLFGRARMQRRNDPSVTRRRE